MLLNTNEKIKNLDGGDMAAEGSGPEKGLIPLTIGHICAGALVAPLRVDPDNLSECSDRVELAEDIIQGDEVEISAKEAEMLALLINKTVNLPVVVARAVGILQKKEG